MTVWSESPDIDIGADETDISIYGLSLFALSIRPVENLEFPCGQLLLFVLSYQPNEEIDMAKGSGTLQERLKQRMRCSQSPMMFPIPLPIIYLGEKIFWTMRKACETGAFPTRLLNFQKPRNSARR